MSYANPKQYIDNQSTQIQLNLQKTLSDITSKTVSDIGKIYAENSKFNKQLIQQVDNKINKQTSAAIQTHGKNPSVKMGEIYKLSKYVGDLKKSDPTSWTEKQRTTISSWDTLADRMQNTFVNTLSADPGGALSKNADKPGGIDTKRGSKKTHVLLAMANLVDSQKISQFPIDETGFINYNILVKDGETDIGNIVNDTPESTMQLDLVPDILKSIEDKNKIFAGKLDINNPLSPYYTVAKEGEKKAEYKDPLTNQVILRGRYMDIEKVKKGWIAEQEANDYTGLENAGRVSLYETQYKDKNDPSYSYDDPTDAELKIMKDKYLDKEFNIFLAENPNIYKALANPKAEKKGSDKTIPEDYSNIIESWDSNIADDKPENFVNQDISINGSKKTISAASIDPESNELTLSYKSGANDNTKRKTYKLDDNNIHILYKALAGGYNTSFSKSIIAKALKTRKNIKKDSSQITSENTVLDPSNVGAMTEKQQKEARIKKLP